MEIERTFEPGSRWYRWDVHLHAPDTLLNNQFPQRDNAFDFERFIAILETLDPHIVGLGITDYLSLDGYEYLATKKTQGRLKNLPILFPNVEFRLLPTTKGNKAVNAHLLIDPSQPDHLHKAKRALRELSFPFNGAKHACDREGLVEFGRACARNSALPERQALETAAMQLKLDFSVFRDWYEDQPWLKRNSLVVISTSSQDGISALRRSGLKAASLEFERFAHAFFSPNDGDREFWLGRHKDYTKQTFAEEYGRPRPCLHGSDAHKFDDICRPADERYCWVKAEPTFHGLRQVLLEPEDRVHIGTSPPRYSSPHLTIKSLEVEGAEHWYPTRSMPLPYGLTAVIGGKGSGKTALLDLIAAAGGAKKFGETSFRSRAREHLVGTCCALTWHDGSTNPKTQVLNPSATGPPSIKYLSQQFVDRLCSDRGNEGLLVQEIEDVVFRATPEIDRLDAPDFKALVTRRTRSVRSQRAELQARILTTCDQLYELSTMSDSLPKLDVERTQRRKEVSQLEKREIELTGTKIDPEASKSRERLHAAIQSQVSRLALLKAREKALLEAHSKTREAEARVKKIVDELNANLQAVLAPDYVPAQLALSPNPIPLIESQLQTLHQQIAELVGAPEKEGSYTWHSRELEKITEALNLGGRITTELKSVRELLCRHRLEIEGIGNKIKEIQTQVPTARQELQTGRLNDYVEVFETLRQEREILTELYAPLTQKIESQSGDVVNLALTLDTVVDVEAWLERGFSLFDGRKLNAEHLAGELKGYLLDAWQKQDGEKIREGMASAIKLLWPSFLERGRASASPRDFARWLFSTEHIRFDYALTYKGLQLEKLSQGTCGIVLLMLFLELDSEDRTPLLIDQPEENLDSKTVHDVLVPYIRQAKKRRQIILVTHNPNLVVNTDAEMVIVANSEVNDPKAMPKITYSFGGLENPSIRDEVCAILEGGEEAFRDRDRRYAGAIF